MSDQALALASRRGALGERIAAQRAALTQHAAGVELLCARADTVRDGINWLKRHPAAVGGAVLAVVVARPRRAWRWARRGLVLWRGWRSLRGHLQLER